jgi:hypothetical protein
LYPVCSSIKAGVTNLHVVVNESARFVLTNCKYFGLYGSANVFEIDVHLLLI